MKLSTIELSLIRLFALIEKTRVTRYVYIWAAMVMSWKFIVWAWHFAESSLRPGTDVAMIIGAIGVPLSVVTTFAFKDYNASSRTSNETQ